MYCCAINCSNNSHSVDPRTELPVRMHKFPSASKERERCLRWIQNLGRADLNIKNITYKRVCSTHFEVSSYNCPTDISSSSLMNTAAPTIVSYENPPNPQNSLRKPPKQKLAMNHEGSSSKSSSTSISPQSCKREFSDVEESDSFEPPVRFFKAEPSSTVDSATALLEAQKEIAKLKNDSDTALLEAQKEIAKLKNDSATAFLEAQKEIAKLKKEKIQLARKLKGAKQKCVDVELAARKRILNYQDKHLKNILSKLPPVPRNLLQILLMKEIINDQK